MHVLKAMGGVLNSMAQQVALVEDVLAMQRLVTKWVTKAGYELASVRGRGSIRVA